MMKNQKEKNGSGKVTKKCEICYGHGWWPIGIVNPIGELDAEEWGKKVIKCPWCGAGYVDEGDRYDYLVRHKADKNGDKE